MNEFENKSLPTGLIPLKHQVAGSGKHLVESTRGAGHLNGNMNIGFSN